MTFAILMAITFLACVGAITIGALIAIALGWLPAVTLKRRDDIGDSECR